MRRWNNTPNNGSADCLFYEAASSTASDGLTSCLVFARNLAMGGVQAVGKLLGIGWKQVSIPVHGDLDRGMPKMGLDGLGMCPLGDEECCTRVSEVVRSQVSPTASRVGRHAESPACHATERDLGGMSHQAYPWRAALVTSAFGIAENPPQEPLHIDWLPYARNGAEFHPP